MRNLSLGGLQNFAEGYKGRVDTCVVELDCIFSAKKDLHYVFSLALQFDNEKILRPAEYYSARKKKCH